MLGDINIAEAATVESRADTYSSVSNAGTFLDITNKGKLDSDYIDYGWLATAVDDNLEVNVSAGEGYVNGVRVNTADQNSVSLTASTTNYIFMSDAGEVLATTTQTLSEPSVLIAIVQTDQTKTVAVANERANEIIVAKQGGKYRTIMDALNSVINASARNRFTIMVKPGVYNEQIMLKPYVDIIGAGKDNTTIMAINKPVIETQNFAFLSLAGAESQASTTATVAESQALGYGEGDVKIANIKLSLAGDTLGQAIVIASSTNLTLEDVNLNWSGDEGLISTGVEVKGLGKVSISRLNSVGTSYGLTQKVSAEATATSTVNLSYSNISSSLADIRTVNEKTATGTVSAFAAANIISSYNTLTGSGVNFEIAEDTIISSAHDTYLTYSGAGVFRQNDYFRKINNSSASLFNVQNAGINLFNISASGTVAINPQNTTGDSVIISSPTASTTLTVINTGAGVALKVVGNLILTSATSSIPVVLSSAGSQLNVGAPGDIVNLNVEGVTYNFKENVRRNTLSAYLPAPVSGDRIWGDGVNSWSPPENITILGVKVNYNCGEDGLLQMTLKNKNGENITTLNGNTCGGYAKIEKNDLKYQLTPEEGMYVEVNTATEGVINVTITIEFIYDNR